MQNRFDSKIFSLIALIIVSFSLSCSQKSEFSGGNAVIKEYDAKYGKGVELQNTPSDPSNATELAVQVVGEDLVAYQYIILEGDQSCEGGGYSEDQAVDALISDKIEGEDGLRKICAIGKAQDTGYQSRATEYSWTFDKTPPGDFSISGLAPVTRTPPTSVAWSASEDAVSYNLKFTKLSNCGGDVIKEETLTELSIALPTLVDGFYSVCVTAVDAADNKTSAANSPFNFEIDRNPPGAFTINAPRPVTNETSPVVSWSGSVDAVRYKVIVASDALCANIIETANITQPTYQVLAALSNRTSYYTCVEASDAAGNVTLPSNNKRRFTIDTDAVLVSFDPTTLPAADTNLTAVSIRVLGPSQSSDFDAYRAVIGPETIDCDLEATYPATVFAKTDLITQNMASRPDGVYKVCAYARDRAGNWALPASHDEYTWRIDRVAPVIAAFNLDQLCGPKALTCDGDGDGNAANDAVNYIKYDIQTSDTNGSGMAAPTATAPISGLQIKFAASDGKFLASNGLFSSVQPVLYNLNHSNGRNIPTQAILRKSSLISHSGTYQFTVTATDRAGNSTSMTKPFVWDDIAPTIASYTLGNSLVKSTKPAVSSALVASDTISGVRQMCKKSVIGTAVPTTANCNWTTYTQNANVVIGFVPSQYNMYAWVRDNALNESPLKVTAIEFAPSAVPKFIQVSASASNSAINTTVAAGGAVYIKWRVEDDTNFQTNPAPISLQYTNNEVDWMPIASGLTAGQNGSTACTAGAQGNAKIIDGCYVWSLAATVPATANPYTKIRVVAMDVDSQVSYSTAAPLNLSNVNFLAGNTEIGFGASARSTVFQNLVDSSLGFADPSSLVVTSRGEFVFRDYRRGLLIVRPDSGVLMPLIGDSGTARAFSAPGVKVPFSPTLKLNSPVNIAKDFQDRILVLESDRLSRIDLSTTPPTLELLAGGTAPNVAGANENDTVANAFELKIRLEKNGRDGRTLYALPSGKVVFTSELDHISKDSNNNPFNRLRIYTPPTAPATVGSVASKLYGGTFTFARAGYNDADSNLNRSARNCRGWSKAIGYTKNLSTSGVASETFNAATIVLHGMNTPGQPILPNCQTPNNTYLVKHFYIQPATLNQPTLIVENSSALDINPLVPGEGIYLWSSPIVGLDGKIYSVDRSYGGISRFNPGTKKFERIVGIGKQGSACPDLTLASQCAIDPLDVFVDESSNIYFMDRGRVRTLVSTPQGNKVITIFGQSYGYGDGLHPLSARFGDINRFANYTSSNGNRKIVVLDALDQVFREAQIKINSSGADVIERIAGSGYAEKIVLGSNVDAKTHGLELVAWGQTLDDFSVTDSGEVLFRTPKEFIKLGLPTGSNSLRVWTAISGTTTGRKKFWNVAADLTPTSEIDLDTNGVFSKILGFVNNEIIAVDSVFNQREAPALAHSDAAIMKVGIGTNGVFNKIAGTTGVSTYRAADFESGCAMNSLAKSCKLVTAFGISYSPVKALYRPTVGTTPAAYEYAFAYLGTNSIYMIDRTGKIQNYETFTKTVNGQPVADNIYAFAIKAGSGTTQDTIFYCADGKIKKKVRGSTTAPVELYIGPTSTCSSREMVYLPPVGSTPAKLMFIYSNNNLNGIAEYINP